MSFTQARRASVTDSELGKADSYTHNMTSEPLQYYPPLPRWEKAKTGLRVTSFSLGIPLFILSLVGFAGAKAFSTYAIFGTAIGAAILSIDIADLIVRWRTKRCISPSVTLGLELCIGIAGIILSVFMVFSLVDVWMLRRYFNGGGADSSGWIPYPDYVANGYTYASMGTAVATLSILLSLMHTAIFVGNCVEVDQVRKAGKKYLAERAAAQQQHQAQQQSRHQTQTPVSRIPSYPQELSSSDYNVAELEQKVRIDGINIDNEKVHDVKA
ncbi:hypothetical protein M426DRAFT_26756 [Hypoxylon sp. CI-4A]|nr:hypothetical protein M426DRAFT_26756 [Hypoxylon sp. CI-4A]